MTRYVAQFVVHSCPRISEPVHFAISDEVGETLEIVLEPRALRDPFGTPVPAGMFIDVTMSAATIETFVLDAQTAADVVIDQVALAAPRWIGEAEARFAYALDGLPREVLLYSDGWETHDLQHMVVDSKQLIDGVASYFGKSDDRRWRTGHAAKQFRASLVSEDPAARVVTVYSGLEFMNPLLTGPELYGGRGQAKGVGAYLQGELGLTDEEKARRTRNAVVHGKQAVAEILTSLAEVEGPLLEALRTAIRRELDLPPDGWKAPELITPARSGNTISQFFGRLDPNEAGEVAPVGFRHPRMEVEWQIAGSSIGPDGVYTADTRPVIKATLAEGAQLRVMDLQAGDLVEEVPVRIVPLDPPS